MDSNMDSSGSNGQHPGNPPYNQNPPYPQYPGGNPAYSNQYASYPQPQYQGAMQAPYPQYQGAMQQAQYPQYQGAMQQAPYPQYQGAMQQAQYPQYQGATPQAPYGPVQQGYGRFPGRPFENRKENPCGCCCGTATAAKTLAVLNVIYLVLETFGVAVPRSMIEERGSADFGLYLSCKLLQREEGTLLYILAITLFSLGISASLCATIGFMVAVFGKTQTKTEILWSKIYMWASFCYPGWLCHLLLLIDISKLRRRHCESAFLSIYTTYFTFIVIWIFSNGLVGKAYRNMTQRKQQAMEGDQPQEANVAEPEDTSSPTEAEAAPEAEAEKAEASGTEVP